VVAPTYKVTTKQNYVTFYGDCSYKDFTITTPWVEMEVEGQ
jgi:hypothetical protein